MIALVNYLASLNSTKPKIVPRSERVARRLNALHLAPYCTLVGR